MKVWLDDERPMPPQYNVHVRTAKEAIELLKTGEVTHISLDNDLGPPEAGEGIQVADFIEEGAFLGTLSKLRVDIHTANPVAKERMRMSRHNAWKYWTKGEEDGSV